MEVGVRGFLTNLSHTTLKCDLLLFTVNFLVSQYLTCTSSFTLYCFRPNCVCVSISKFIQMDIIIRRVKMQFVVSPAGVDGSLSSW